MQNHHSHLQNRKGLHTKVRRPSCLVFYYGPYYTQEIHRLQVFFYTPVGVRVKKVLRILRFDGPFRPKGCGIAHGAALRPGFRGFRRFKGFRGCGIALAGDEFYSRSAAAANRRHYNSPLN